MVWEQELSDADYITALLFQNQKWHYNHNCQATGKYPFYIRANFSNNLHLTYSEYWNTIEKLEKIKV